MKVRFAVSLNGTPLERLRKDYGKDQWKESGLMSEMRTAKSWGLTPSAWFDEPLESREVMIAYENVEADVSAVIRWQDKAKK